MIRCAVVMAVACSSKEPPKPPTAYDHFVAQIAALGPALDGLDKQLSAAKTDCKAVVRALVDFGARHRNDLLALRPLVAKLSAEESARARAISPSLLSSMTIQGIVYGCQNEPEIVTALESAGFLPTAEAVP